jgi:hypothetical protein
LQTQSAEEANVYTEKTQRLIDSVQGRPGITDPYTRREIVAYARAAALHEENDSEPDSSLKPYLDKVVHHAYKVVDADVERLKRTDYSEDEIFELTVAAALGASIARLERGFSLVDESNDERDAE